MALETLKELEDCLKKLDSGVERRRRNWANQQKDEVNKLELGNQLKRSWQNLLGDHFEEAMRTSSSALPLMANPSIRTAGTNVHVEPGGNRVRDTDLVRQVETVRQESRGVSSTDATRGQR